MVDKLPIHRIQGGTKRNRSDRLKSRACDRCRVRKSKCDGKRPCKTCVDNDSVCGYAAKKESDAKKQLLRMTEVIEKGLHILYKTTQEHECFPGTLPLQEEQQPTTRKILAALGLSAQLPEEKDSLHLAGSSRDGHTSFSIKSEISTNERKPVSTHPEPRAPSLGFATSSDATKHFEGEFGISQENHRPPENLRRQQRFSSCSSQATTLNEYPSIPAPEQPADMRTQFDIAVGCSQPRNPSPMIPLFSPNSLQSSKLDDAFFDFERYNQENIISLMQAQQRQPDRMLHYSQAPMPGC